MIPPSEKDREWHLAFCKSFKNEFDLGGGKLLGFMTDHYEKDRLYASGKQPIDQYKQMLTMHRNKGKNKMSWRNLDWNILPILPTIVNIVINKVLGQNKDILIRAIDPISQNEERARRNQILTYLANRRIIQMVEEQFGVSVQSPMIPGAPMPANMQEIELHLAMYPKDRHIMELYDQIDRVMSLNGWMEIWNQVVRDLVEVGIGGTKAWIDLNGEIRVRRVIPEMIITNSVTKPDFSDLRRVAELIPMSIAELRASVPPGTFSEADFVRMANLSSKGRRYSTQGIESYFRAHYRYPYDAETVMTMDAEWLSADDYAYVKEWNNRGNLALEKQKDPYWLSRVQWTDEEGRVHTGVSDKQYEEYHRNLGSKREVIRNSYINLYGAKWVVGTEYVFDWGLKSNMRRAISKLGQTSTNYQFYTFFDSFVRRAEPVADQIQINWLQHQHHVANSRPDGLKINKRALTTMKVSGKGGQGMELDEVDLLQMYTESGSFVYKGEDAGGRPYPYDPIQELKGGISEAAMQHMQMIIQHIDFLRTVFGLNEVTDASTPNPKLGKKVAELMEQSTNTALGSIYHAYSNLYERTVQAIALLVPDAEMIKSSAKDEGLGESSGQFFRANNDLTFREHGIIIEDGPTEEVKATLRKYTELAIQAQELRPEDAYLIENEKNIMRAYWLLAMKRRQKMEEDQRMKAETFEMENQKNVESAKVAAQAKAEADIASSQAEMQKEVALHPLKKELAALDIVGKIILKKMEAGAQLTAEENKAVNRYLEILTQGELNKDLEAMRGENKRKEFKMKPKAAPKKTKAA